MSLGANAGGHRDAPPLLDPLRGAAVACRKPGRLLLQEEAGLINAIQKSLPLEVKIAIFHAKGRRPLNEFSGRNHECIFVLCSSKKSEDGGSINSQLQNLQSKVKNTKVDFETIVLHEQPWEEEFIAIVIIGHILRIEIVVPDEQDDDDGCTHKQRLDVISAMVSASKRQKIHTEKKHLVENLIVTDLNFKFEALPRSP